MKLYPILFEQFNNKETYPNFSEQDVELEGTARVEGTEIVLTDDYHQSGKATLKSPIDLHERSWKADIVFQIEGSEGVRDAEGRGGDGISLIFSGNEGLVEDGLVINFDTYKNLENNSGNEIVLRVENSVVEKKYVHRKMNDGNPHHFRIHYNNPEQVISVHELVNGKEVAKAKPILSYAFSEYPLGELLKGDCSISFSSFTGDAKGVHKVLKFEIKYV